MSNYFNDSEYFSRLFSNEVSQNNENTAAKDNAIRDGRLKEAYKQAADIRKFEIELFWKRGTYYWAFILAAFTAHFALLGMLFSTCSPTMNQEFSLKNLCALPGLSLFTLALTAFFCFFFSLAWTLVNKGSKFWQKNWEAHIDVLEEHVTGRLHETYLNTEGDKNDFSRCPLDVKAYDYSVTKITLLTSILLSTVSGGLFLFYAGVFIFKDTKCCNFCSDMAKRIISSSIILLFFVGFIKIMLNYGKSSNFESDRKQANRWYQRQK